MIPDKRDLTFDTGEITVWTQSDTNEILAQVYDIHDLVEDGIMTGTFMIRDNSCLVKWTCNNIETLH